MTKRIINCFVCGTWIKQNKSGLYICPKCKAIYETKDKQIERIFKLENELHE